jgi:hypothetical protein
VESIQGRICIAFLAFFIVASAAEGFAEEMYKYIDKNGNPCFTDDVQLVPDEYRKKAVKIYVRPEVQDSKQGRPTGDSPRIEARQEGSPAEAGGAAKKDPFAFFSIGWVLRVAAALAAFMLVMCAIGKVADRVGYSQVGTMIKIGLTFMGLLYVFGSYAGEMAETFNALKEEIVDIKAKKEKNDAQVRQTAEESAHAPSR